MKEVLGNLQKQRHIETNHRLVELEETSWIIYPTSSFINNKNNQSKKWKHAVKGRRNNKIILYSHENSTFLFFYVTNQLESLKGEFFYLIK
jgi:hypothetical protein